MDNLIQNNLKQTRNTMVTNVSAEYWLHLNEYPMLTCIRIQGRFINVVVQ